MTTYIFFIYPPVLKSIQFTYYKNNYNSEIYYNVIRKLSNRNKRLYTYSIYNRNRRCVVPYNNTHVYIYTHTKHMYIYIIHAYTHMYIYTYIYIHTYTYTHAYTYIIPIQTYTYHCNIVLLAYTTCIKHTENKFNCYSISYITASVTPLPKRNYKRGMCRVA